MSKIILSPRGTVGCVAVAVAVAVADKAGGRLLGIVPLLSLLCLPGTFPLSVLALDAGSLSLLPELWFPSLRLPQSSGLTSPCLCAGFQRGLGGWVPLFLLREDPQESQEGLTFTV